MFQRNTPTVTPSTWSDPPPTSDPLLSTPIPTSVQRQNLHPIAELFLGSTIMRGITTTFAGCTAVTAGMLAMRRAPEEIVSANLYLVAFVFGLIALSGAIHMLGLNAQALGIVVKMVRAASRARAGSPAQSGADEGVYNYADEPEPQSEIPSGGRVIELMPTNRRNPDILQSNGVAIDKRDFTAFLNRAWESNDVPEQGLSRIHWVGGRRKDGTAGEQYTFQRSDGSSQICTRRYYDAIMDKLESIHEIEGRIPGFSGKLRRDPRIWIAASTWL